MGQGVLWLRYYYIHSCFIPCTHSLCGLSWNWSLATYLATSYVSAVLSPCKTNSQLHLLRGSLDKCITDQFHKQSIFLQPFCSRLQVMTTDIGIIHLPMYQMEDGIGIGKLSGKKKLLYRSRKNVCRKVHPSCFGNQPKSCEEPVVLQKPHKKNLVEYRTKHKRG